MPNIRQPGQYQDDIAKAALEEDETPTPEADKKEEKKEEKDSRSPLEKWRANIAAVKVDEDEAEAILVEILTKGHWHKTFSLARGKLRLTLRTRDAQVLNKLQATIDNMKTFDQRVNYLASNRLFLAGSLEAINDKSLPFPKKGDNLLEVEKCYQERLNFIDTELAQPILETLIYPALQKFDTIVSAVMSEGCGEGF